MVLQKQIVFYQLLQELYGAGAVREGMEHFKINAVFIIGNLEEQGFSVPDIQIQTGRLRLFLYLRLQFALFQVIPEKSLAHDGKENGIFVNRFIQGSLKPAAVCRLLKLTVEAEYPGILFAAGSREDFCGVVQFSPIRSFGAKHFIHSPSEID